MIENELVFIYALKDPDTLAVRYIGKTHSPRPRLSHHLHPIPGREGTPVKRWVAQLGEAGKKPVMEILEQAPVSEGVQRELHWINHHNPNQLLNVRCGVHPPSLPNEKPKMGRPPGKSYQRYKSLALTKQEFAALERMAQKRGHTASAVLRDLLREGARREGVWEE